MPSPRKPKCSNDARQGAAEGRSAVAYESRVEKRKLSELMDYPRQDIYFPDESQEADRELATSMDAEGQREPIHTLPDGTVLCGHRRVRAARSLGWEEIDVIVHHELADDPAAAEAFFIGDNYERRQLSELQKVRCAARRVELAKQGKVSLSSECDGLSKTRDKIGALLNKSGREADRYLRVLKTPIEVQHACDAGHLSLVEAGKVTGFADETQSEIARELREQGLEQAKTIFDRYRPSKAANCRGAESIWLNLRRALDEAVKELSGNVGNLRWLDQEDLELVQQGEELLDELKIDIIKRLEEVELDDEDIDDFDHENQISDVLGNAAVDTLSTAPRTLEVDTVSTPSGT